MHVKILAGHKSRQDKQGHYGVGSTMRHTHELGISVIKLHKFFGIHIMIDLKPVFA